MSLENWQISRRHFLAVIGGTVLVKPLSNIDNTNRRIWGLLGGQIGSSDRETTRSIAVFGGDRIVQGNRLTLAAEQYLERQRPIVLLDGYNDDKDKLFSQRDFFKSEVSRLSLGTVTVPDDAFIVDSKSINTVTNAKELEKIIRTNRSLEPVGIVTSPDHMARAIGAVCDLGIDAVPLVDANTTSLSECLKQILAIWDPDGWLTTFVLTKFFGLSYS